MTWRDHGSPLSVVLLSLSVGSPGRETRGVNGLRLLGVEWDGNSKVAQALDRAQPVRAFALAVAALMLLASLASAPRAPHAQLRGPDVAVIVRAESAHISSVEGLVARLGGSVGRHLAIIDGFTARVPAGSIGRLAGADGVRAVTADARGRMLSVDPALGYDPAA